MPVTKNYLNDAELNGYVRSEFENAYQKALDTSYLAFVMETTSDGDAETYAFLEGIGDLRPWVGDRQWQVMRRHDYTVTNVKKEFTPAVDREAVEDDKSGQLLREISRSAAAFAHWKTRYAAHALESGFATTNYGACLDGQAFFSATHPYADSGNFSNTISQNLDATYLASTITMLMGMNKYKDADANSKREAWGNVPGKENMVLVVPSGLYMTAVTLLTNPDASGAGNPLAGMVDLVMNPFLTTKGTPANSAWYLAVKPSAPASGGFAPVGWQSRVPYTIDDYDEHILFNKDIYVWGGRVRGQWYYTFPQLCVSSAGT